MVDDANVRSSLSDTYDLLPPSPGELASLVANGPDRDALQQVLSSRDWQPTKMVVRQQKKRKRQLRAHRHRSATSNRFESRTCHWWLLLSNSLREAFWSGKAGELFGNDATHLAARCRVVCEALQGREDWPLDALMCALRVLEVRSFLLLLGLVDADDTCHSAITWFFRILWRSVRTEHSEPLTTGESITGDQAIYQSLLNRTCDLLSSILTRVPVSSDTQVQVGRLQDMMMAFMEIASPIVVTRPCWYHPSPLTASHVIAKLYVHQGRPTTRIWEWVWKLLQRCQKMYLPKKTAVSSCQDLAVFDRGAMHIDILDASFRLLVHLIQADIASSAAKHTVLTSPTSASAMGKCQVAKPEATLHATAEWQPAEGEIVTPGHSIDESAWTTDKIENLIRKSAQLLLRLPNLASSNAAAHQSMLRDLAQVVQGLRDSPRWPVVHILLQAFVVTLTQFMPEASPTTDACLGLLEMSQTIGTMLLSSSVGSVRREQTGIVTSKHPGAIARAVQAIYRDDYWCGQLTMGSEETVALQAQTRYVHNLWSRILRATRHRVNDLLVVMQDRLMEPDALVHFHVMDRVCRLVVIWPGLVRSPRFDLGALLQRAQSVQSVQRDDKVACDTLLRLMMHGEWNDHQLMNWIKYGVPACLQHLKLRHGVFIWLLKVLHSVKNRECLPQEMIAKLCLQCLTSSSMSDDTLAVLAVLEEVWHTERDDWPTLAMRISDCLTTVDGVTYWALALFFCFCMGRRSQRDWIGFMEFVVQSSIRETATRAPGGPSSELFRAVICAKSDLLREDQVLALVQQTQSSMNTVFLSAITCVPQFPRGTRGDCSRLLMDKGKDLSSMHVLPSISPGADQEIEDVHMTGYDPGHQDLVVSTTGHPHRASQPPQSTVMAQHGVDLDLNQRNSCGGKKRGQKTKPGRVIPSVKVIANMGRLVRRQSARLQERAQQGLIAAKSY